MKPVINEKNYLVPFSWLKDGIPYFDIHFEVC